MGNNTTNKKNLSSNKNGKIIIYGYSENFLINSLIRIKINNKQIGYIGYKGYMEIPITEDGKLQFQCLMKNYSIDVKKHEEITLILSFHKLTGELYISSQAV